MTVEIEQFTLDGGWKALLDEVTRSSADIDSIVIGYVTKDGTLKSHYGYSDPAHMVALLGAFREYTRQVIEAAE